MATEAFTLNLIELPSCVITKTGTCARLTDGSTADAKRHRTVNRMGFLPEQNHGEKILRIRGACQDGAPHAPVKSYRSLQGPKRRRLSIGEPQPVNFDRLRKTLPSLASMMCRLGVSWIGQSRGSRSMLLLERCEMGRFSSSRRVPISLVAPPKKRIQERPCLMCNCISPRQARGES